MKNAKYFKIAAIISGLVGLLLFISNSTQFTNARFGRFWKTAEGTISSCKIDDDELSKLGSLCKVYYEVQFSADQKTIKFDEKDPLSGSQSYEEALKRSKLYPPGTKVIVYYDPTGAGFPFFDRPDGPVVAKLSNMWPTLIGLLLVSLAFIFGLFTEFKRVLLVIAVQFMRLLIAVAIIFCFSVIESIYPSKITIGLLIASIPLSVIIVIFLFKPLLKAINRTQAK
jgi:hypothetical protein